jgi:hypothetical protein
MASRGLSCTLTKAAVGPLDSLPANLHHPRRQCQLAALSQLKKPFNAWVLERILDPPDGEVVVPAAE